MSRAEIAFPAVLFAIVGSLLAAGLFVFKYSWTVIGFPLGAGTLVCLLCLLDIVMTLTGHRPQPVADDTPSQPLATSCVLWIFALGGFIYALGFVFGPAAYLLVYLRANGSSWRVSLAISLASFLATYLLFIKLLRVLLPIEPLWWPWA